MPDLKISQLPAVDLNTLNSGEQLPFPLVQAGTTVKMTLQEWITVIQSSIPSGADGVGLVNGFAVVNASRDYQIGDVGKVLGLAPGVQMTMPGGQTFSEGNVIGIIAIGTGNNSCSYEDESNRQVFPSYDNGAGFFSEFVVLNNHNNSGQSGFSAVATSILLDSGDANYKTFNRYSEDNPSSGGGGLISDTYANILALVNGSSLVPGGFYKITNRGDLGIILQATETDEFSGAGSGGFLNCDYGEYGNDISANSRYAGIFGITGVNPATNWAQWAVSKEITRITYNNQVGGLFPTTFPITGSISGATANMITDSGGTIYINKTSQIDFQNGETIDNGNGVTADITGFLQNTSPKNNGDIFFWNNEHYQLIDVTAIDATNPSLNNTAYSVALSRTVANTGYESAWDYIEYYFETDILSMRADQYGSVIRGQFNISIFPWGQYNVHFILDNEDGTLDIRNNSNVSGWTGGRILGYSYNIAITETSISFFIDVSGNNHTILSNKNSSILKLHVTGNNVTINADNNSAPISGTYKNVTVDHSNNAGAITDSEFENGNYTIVLDKTHSLTKCKVVNSGTFVIPSNKSFANKILDNNGSSFDAIVDITGGGSIDLGGTTTNKYAGVIEMTSTNANETVNAITNGNTLFGYLIVPTQLTGILDKVTVVSTAKGVAVAGDICLENNANVYLRFGIENLGDNLQLTTGASGINRQTDGSIL